MISPPRRGSHFGIKPCPPLKQEDLCNRHLCPVKPADAKPIIDSAQCGKFSVGKDAMQRILGRRVGHLAARHDMCGACVANPGCGFCPNSGLCLPGTPQGPIPRWKSDDMPAFASDKDVVKLYKYATNCSQWSYAQCTAEPCKEYGSCSECLADPYCGWCGMTQTCVEGQMGGGTAEYCPRGWVNSPLHDGWDEIMPDESNGDGENDVFLRSAQAQMQMLDKLPAACAAVELESERLIKGKVHDEIERQERLRAARETCGACGGTWPYCDCGNNVPRNATPNLKPEHVARSRDEADVVDYTLPRPDAIDKDWNHGRPKQVLGDPCAEASDCASSACVRGVCCSRDLDFCSGHGTCERMGQECRCDPGFTGRTCVPAPKVVEEVDPLDQFAGMLGGLDDDSWMEKDA